MIRAIVVDDEPLAVQLLAQKLQTIKDVEVVKTFTNPLLLLEELKHLSFNIAFLDIEMPGINGIDLAEHILAVNPSVSIVFVSAYRDYAVQAFELNSIDYILKPLTSDRLTKTITRIQNMPPPEPQISAEPLRIQCFSEFIGYFDSRPVKWKTAKVKELFAFFITHHKTYINRDVLIETLWPDTDYDKAKIQLHTALSHLRKTLEKMGYSKVITFANQSYCLELTSFQCDALLIKSLLVEHPRVTADTIALFEDAASQYTGEYLGQENYEWQYLHAAEYRQYMSQLLHQIIDYFDEINDMAKKEIYISNLFQLDPYSEQFLQKLLEHYIQTGNRTDAIRVYHDFKDRIEDEFGISPNQSTNALYNQVLFSDQY